ncbi:shikimate kinase [Halobacteriales archaeon QS_8_69_73]|nr:MAG: shikimate kinase [Halobacteriales archaeon QS_8_69_73]
MEGRAAAPAAGTVLNALANGYGAAFAIDAHTEATVELDGTGEVTAEVAGAPDADTGLIERCVAAAVERVGDGEGGHVRTESDVPIAAGLKSSSAAANATMLAALSALDAADELSRKAACRLGVDAARDAGVTVTGAFDDASASMLGGITVTDNDADELLRRDEPGWEVLVYTPDERALSADADVSRCERVAPAADVVRELAVGGDYERAMCVNGLAFCAALGYPTEPLLEAMPEAAASLSGTGPSYTAVGDRETLCELETVWARREGHTWLTTTHPTGARTL